VGAAFVLQAFDEVADFEASRRFLASGRFGGFARFLAALLLRLLERRFDEAEGGRVDFVLGPFVFDVAGVGEQRQPAGEVDRFARGVRCPWARARTGPFNLTSGLPPSLPCAGRASERRRSPLSIPFSVALSIPFGGSSLLLSLPPPQAARAVATTVKAAKVKR